MSSVPIDSRTSALLAALREYDDAIVGSKAAHQRVSVAESKLRALTHAGSGYMDGNELVASLGRRLAEVISEATGA